MKNKSYAKMTRRSFLGLMALALVGGSSVWANSYSFKVNTYKRSMPKLKAPLRIAQLSDLHFGRFITERQVAHWVDKVIAAKPEVILITGDFIDWTTRDIQPLIRQLSRLSAPLGVWGVWGNHDYDQGLELRDALHEALAQANIRILNNEGVQLREDVFLAGIDDFWKGKPDVLAALGSRPESSHCLLLSHIPDFLPQVPPMVDLTLCGHTHGGQIKLPVIGPLQTASVYGSRFLEGWIEEPVPAFVSRGLGMVLIPIRFMSQSEIALLELSPVA